MSEDSLKVPSNRLINVGRLSREKGTFSGQISLLDSDRLMKIVPSDQDHPQIKVMLDFWVDDSGLIRIEGTITGQVKLICQRCLEPYPEMLNESISLVYFETEERYKGALSKGILPDKEENDFLVMAPIDIQTDRPHDQARFEKSTWLDILQVVEDDLILSVPQVPKHPETSEGLGCGKKVLTSPLLSGVSQAHNGEKRSSKLAEGLAAIKNQLSQKQDG